MNEQIQNVLSSLRERHIKGTFVEHPEEINQRILSLIPADAVVGIGDSTTVRQLRLLQVLKERGQKILNAFDPTEPYGDFMQAAQTRQAIMKQATLCDIFLTGTNALTEDGRLVNLDAVGNRVAGMFWGHPKSIIVVGMNKIVSTLDEAFTRIREVIAPTHFHIRTAELGGMERDTPCVRTGRCNDCKSKDRGCNVFTIIEGKPKRTDLNVVLVNRDLGLGWDPAWPQERIAQIRENYKRFVWVPPRTNPSSSER